MLTFFSGGHYRLSSISPPPGARDIRRKGDLHSMRGELRAEADELAAR